MAATFSDMSDHRFTVVAVAPEAFVREYAFCKAVWFAEKSRANSIAISDPVAVPQTSNALLGPLAPSPDWPAFRATAYLEGPGPDNRPARKLSELVGACRRSWDWYR